MAEPASKTSDVLRGTVIGFIAAAALSLYLIKQIGTAIPLSLLYGITAPMISAFAIIIIMSARKEKRKQLFDPVYYRKTQQKELSEKRKKLRSSYVVK